MRSSDTSARFCSSLALKCCGLTEMVGALTLMAGAQAVPQVVLCDVHLRDGPNGLWLADRIRERHPTTAMILATGDATVPPVQSLRKGIVAYLVKPFRREDVLQAVEEGLGVGDVHSGDVVDGIAGEGDFGFCVLNFGFTAVAVFGLDLIVFAACGAAGVAV